MIRTAATNKREDDTDTAGLTVCLDRFGPLIKGYMTGGREFPNPVEIDQLAFSGKLLTLECGIRFLTGYLQGDTYFKVTHPDHNLDRCRNNFAYVAAIEGKLSQMQDIVAAQAGAGSI